MNKLFCKAIFVVLDNTLLNSSNEISSYDMGIL